MTNDPLVELARAYADARLELAEATSAREELEPAWKAAGERLAKAQNRVKLIEAGAEAARRAEAILRALEDIGVARDSDQVAQNPPVVLKSLSYRHSGIPDVFELVALGPEGTALYRSTQKRSSRGGRAYLRRRRREDVVVPPPEDAPHWSRHPRLESGQLIDPITQLLNWEKRGKDQYGTYDGAISPKPPPEGGRWRWLKPDFDAVQSQLEQETAGAAG